MSNKITAAILESQNNKTAAVLVYQTNPVGVERFSYTNTFFYCIAAGHVNENALMALKYPFSCNKMANWLVQALLAKGSKILIALLTIALL